MTNIYAMQRANGDWFALEDRGRLRVPLFRSSHDAVMARLRNFQMLLFKPVVMDARLRKEIKPPGGGSKVDFFIVRDPFASLTGGRPLQPAQLASLMNNHDEGPTVPHNGNGFHDPRRNDLPHGEWWN
jgi:hypothetical protein